MTSLADIMDVNAEAERVHIANEKWWVDINTGERLNRDKNEQAMLVISELAEALEGYRKNLMDNHLPQYRMERVEIIDCFIRMLDWRHGHGCREPFNYTEYESVGPSDLSVGGTLFGISRNVTKMVHIPTGVIEWYTTDWIINSLFWYACWQGWTNQFYEIYNAKMDYNATRVDHSIEHRLSAHGKKI